MKALIAVAVVVTSAPLVAAMSDQSGAAAPKERKICARVEQRSGSRMGFRRTCRTASEWREAYGPDWRQELSGNPSIEDQMDSLGARNSEGTQGTSGFRSKGPG